MTSLQDLQRQTQLPPETDPVWRFVRLAYHGKSMKKKAQYLLTKAGFLDNNGWTTLGKLALAKVKEEIHVESQKRKRLRKSG